MSNLPVVNDSLGWGGFLYKVLVLVFVPRILSEAGVLMNYFPGLLLLGINDFLCTKVSTWNIGKMLHVCYVQEKKTQDDHSRSLILIWNYQDSVRFVVCYIWNVNYYVKIPNKSTSLTHLQYIHQWIFALLLSQKNSLSQQCLTLGTYINNLQVSTNFLSHKYVHEWFKSLILQNYRDIQE